MRQALALALCVTLWASPAFALESERARAEVAEALRIRPVDPLISPAERIRDTAVALHERRLRAEVRVGGFYDDNVTVNPRPSSDPTAEARRQRSHNSPGILGGLRLDYSWLRSGPWEATATYSFLHIENTRRNLAVSNIQNHLGGLGLFYRGRVSPTMPYLLGAQYTYDYTLVEYNAFLQRHTGTLFGTLVENAGNLTTVLGHIQDKEYLNDEAALVAQPGGIVIGAGPGGTALGAGPRDRRDAQNWMAGLIHVFRFEADKHLIRLGYQFDYDDAEGANYTYLGHRLLAGLLYTLPDHLPGLAHPRFRYDYELHRRAYDERHSTFPVAAPNTIQRKDIEHFHHVRIEQPLRNGFTVALGWQGTINNSNLAVFAFDRNVYSLILSWHY